MKGANEGANENVSPHRDNNMRPIGNVLVDYYRCPEALVPLRIQTSAADSEGFFRFGESVVCYGRSTCGTRAAYVNGNLVDAKSRVTIDGGIPVLPFNPDEVVENLRRERYVSALGSDDLMSSAVRVGRFLYYGLRPALPFTARSYIKRAYLAGWEKTSFPRWPVDTNVEHLLESLLKLSLSTQQLPEMPFIWFWPDGFESCAVMTHDVETVTGRDFINTVMDLDESAGIRASFQLIPEGRYTISDTLIRQIRSRGFEVNIHDLNHDGRLFNDRKMFLKRVQQINDYSRQYGTNGYRTGVMYRNQDWYDAFEFEYDMSIPNVAHLDPQQGGCCSVMPYFIGKILELPLTTVQDYCLFHILKKYSIGLWQQQYEIISQRHGMASFIVHPDYVIDERPRAVFRRLLEYLAEVRATGRVWFALPGEVNRWWRQRSRMRLIRDGSGWKTDGDGSERARIAFAYLQDGELAYRISKFPNSRSD
jgi:hypothetical protein